MFRAIAFDLDGTLTEPGAIDFARIRRRIGMPHDGGSILAWIERHVLDAGERARCIDVIHEEERLGLDRMALGAGFEALAGVLRGASRTIRTAILTRNSSDALEAFARLVDDSGLGPHAALFPHRFARGHESAHLGRALFDKPHPEPAHEAVRAWGLDRTHPPVDLADATAPAYPELLFVGDSDDDIESGRRAGFATARLHHGEPRRGRPPATFELRDLADLVELLVARIGP